jgi:hypothetical protein
MRNLKQLICDILDARQYDLPTATATDANVGVLEWALARGYCRWASVGVECSSADGWRGEWQADCGASWPAYTLTVTVDGHEPLEVRGWHVLADFPRDGNGRSGWDMRDDDGAYSGLPKYVAPNDCRPADADEAHPKIEAGTHMNGDLDLPRRDAVTGAVLVYDADAVNKAIEEAAAEEADHGAEPELAELGWEDRNRRHTEVLYLVSDGESREVEIAHAGLYQCGEKYEDDGRPRKKWLLEGWVTDCDLIEGVHPTRDSLVAELEQYGELYDDFADAERAAQEQEAEAE